MTPKNVSRETRKNWETMPLETLLTEAAGGLNVNLGQEQVALLLAFLAELHRWNEKINLIGPSTMAHTVVRHLADSLSPLPFLSARSLRVLDLGSGAGLPGLVLKILRPEWRVTLAESNRKKAAFLKETARKLSLKKIDVLPARMGQRPEPLPLGGFDLITARALAPLRGLLPLARPYLSPGGTILAYKGPRAQQELKDAEQTSADQGLILTRQEKFKLPFLNHQRSLLFFEIS
ncbi:MAG: 16S rRNA (guanine(527)-N(7))-methyltransferase RsmG [Deltaproteobacteria bacterium]|nr:16S rRNA (guanine(527)-N(7))-methyltransferase RsmG [Deltaproteobacteria bacterium]